MMPLDIQIYSSIFNFLYGMFFSLVLHFHYKLIKDLNKKFKIIFNFLFVINSVFLYFIILTKINGGILHIYFFFFFFLAIFVEHKLRKFIANYFN